MLTCSSQLLTLYVPLAICLPGLLGNAVSAAIFLLHPLFKGRKHSVLLFALACADSLYLVMFVSSPFHSCGDYYNMDYVRKNVKNVT